MTGDEHGGLPGPLVEVIRDPSRGRRRLPYLLGSLDEGGARRRLVASLAVCLVVEHDPDLLEYAARRLADRLDDDASIEVRHAFDYLAARHPKRVDGALSDLADEEEARVRRTAYRTGAGFARNDYLTPTGGERALGRARIAGASGGDDPRQVYTGREAGDRNRRVGPSAHGEPAGTSADEPGESERDDAEGPEADGDGRGDGESGDGESGDGESGDGEHGDGESGDGASTPSPGTLSFISRRLSSLIEGSRFEDIDVRSERRRGRYGGVYRAVGRLDDEPIPLALCLFRLPGDDRRAFVADVADALTRWTRVSDHSVVPSVYDWGREPRPWAAIEYTGDRLADRESFDVDAAVWNGLRLANGLSYAHQHGVVHGAIDPDTVVYYGNALTDEERQVPLLAYPGLSTVLGEYVDPASCLAPRYAAPEQYDGDFGSVDHATDVYGLGAVLYRFCTGRPPYTGSLEEVRDGILEDRPPTASEHDPSIPSELDQILRKALATRKLHRYETVTQLAGELRGVRGIDGA